MQKTYQILSCAICGSEKISIKNKETDNTKIIKCDSCNNESFLSNFNVTSVELDSKIVDLLLDKPLIINNFFKQKDNALSFQLDLKKIIEEKCLCLSHGLYPKLFGNIAEGYSTVSVQFCCDGKSKRNFIVNTTPLVKQYAPNLNVNFIFSVKL